MQNSTSKYEENQKTAKELTKIKIRMPGGRQIRSITKRAHMILKLTSKQEIKKLTYITGKTFRRTHTTSNEKLPQFFKKPSTQS